jgi:putative flippase GtrA
MRRSAQFFDAAFVRYGLTSALATATDFALASSLHGLGAVPAAATFFGCVAGGAVAFLVSRFWTFRAEAAPAAPQLARFLFVWATSAFLNSAGVPALLGWLSSFPVAWALVRGAVYLCWNYPLSRWLVFAAEKPRELSAP